MKDQRDAGSAGKRGWPVTRREFLAGVAAVGLSPTLRAADHAAIQRRPIPASGEPLPVVGLGTSRTFDTGDSEAELEPRREVLRALVAAGGSVVDTSPMYGRAEAVVGRAAADTELTGSLFLATKVWTSGRQAGIDQMRTSMDLLRSDTIDLMQVHNRRDMDAHWPTIRQFQGDGFVRYNGITDYRASANAAMLDLMQRYRPDFIQINYSLGERESENEVLPAAQDMGIAVLINRPFMSGRLFRAVGERPVPDWAGEFAASWGQFFLKFIVSHPAVTCVIPATSKLRHMVDNAAAGFDPLPDATTRRRMVDFIGSV